MNFKFSNQSIDKIKTDIVIATCFGTEDNGDEKKKVKSVVKLRSEDGGILIDKKLGGLISKTLKQEEFSGKKCEVKLISTHGKIGARYVAVVGLGKKEKYDLDIIRQVASKLSQVAETTKSKSITFILEAGHINKLEAQDKGRAFAEGALLGSYKFEEHKSKSEREPSSFKEMVMICKGNTKKLQVGIKLGEAVAEAVCYARNLTNLSSTVVTPQALVKEAKKIAHLPRVTVKSLSLAEIKKQKMGAFLAVALSSNKTPAFVHMKYKAPRAKKHIAIIGKGITYDTGGYSIKTRSMETMFSDMAGAAVVLALIKLASKFKLNVAIDGIFAACENMIGENASKPGDVVTSRKGKTIELDNMDAEGRLILADALDYASDLKPDAIVDIATLTGHVPYGIGELYTAVLGNNQELVDKILDTAKSVGEKMWQYPLEKEYKKSMKSERADLKNSGASKAGTITAALFLETFVGKNIKWAHLDIAASSWYDKPHFYNPYGATGIGVRTLFEFLSKY